MDYAAAADALMRRKVLEDIYDRMTDEERKVFVREFLRQGDTQEVLQALQRQSRRLEELPDRRQVFGDSLLSNVAGNAAWSAAQWLLGRLARLA